MLERPIGSVFAGYRIDRVIGRGGMGVVYLATQEALDRRVALKIVAPELGAEATFRERFARELKFVAAVDHPNVIPVYDARSEEGVLFIAMRYVEGTDLRELLLAEGRLTPPRAVDIVEQVAQALDAVHDLGVVHRDVKPANVLIGRRRGVDHVYLTDFGLSKHTTSGLGMTAPGQWVGTVDYVPPEQILGQSLDLRTDVYALGCVLYEVLTGRVPYAKEGDAAKLWAHMHDPPPSLAATGFGLPAGLDAVVARAIAKRPEDRWPSAGALAAAARAAVEQASPTVIGGELPAGEQQTRVSEPGVPRTHPPQPEPGSGAGEPPSETGWRRPSSAPGRPSEPASTPDWRRPAASAPGDATRATGPSEASGAPAPGDATHIVGPDAYGDATRDAGPSQPDSPGGRTPYPSQPGDATRQTDPSQGGDPSRYPSQPGDATRQADPSQPGDATRVTGDSHVRSEPRGGTWLGGTAGSSGRSGVGDVPADAGRPTRVTGPSEVHATPAPPRDGRSAAVAREPRPAAPSGADAGRRPWWRRPPILIAIVALLVVVAVVPLLVTGGGSSGDLATSTVGVGRAPSQIAADGNSVWVVNSGDDTVTRINGAGEAGRPVAAGRSPEAVAVGEDGVWVTNAFGAITRIDPSSGKADGSPIELETDPYAVAAGAGAVWVANGLANTVTVIDPASREVDGSAIDVGLAPYAVAVGGDTVWVANHDSGSVTRIDGGSRETRGSEIEVGQGPTALTVGGGSVWVANQESNDVTRLDAGTGRAQGRPIKVGRAPAAVAFGGGSVWVANADANTVTRIDADTAKVVGEPIPVGRGPQGVAVAGDSVWVANSGSNDVTRIELPDS
jgi:serine/threonine-protein kinase